MWGEQTKELNIDPRSVSGARLRSLIEGRLSRRVVAAAYKRPDLAISLSRN